MGKAPISFTLRTCEQPQDTLSLLESDHRDAERGQVLESRRNRKFGEHIVLQASDRTTELGIELRTFFEGLILSDNFRCSHTSYLGQSQSLQFESTLVTVNLLTEILFSLTSFN